MKRSGKFWQFDENNNILNDAHQEKVDDRYHGLIKAVIQTYLSSLGDKIHSIYLTGSISRGMARINQSDLDAFVVLKEDVRHTAWRVKPEIEHELIEKYPIVSDIQMEIWPWEYIFPINSQFSIGAFIIKTHSVCLFGENLSNLIQSYQLDYHIPYDDISQIKADIEKARKEVKRNNSSINVAHWCKRIMKNIIRTGFSLVMLQENKFTRDLSLCAKIFNKHYPDYQRQMDYALTLSENPTKSVDELLNFLSDFGQWVSVKADQWIKKHV